MVMMTTTMHFPSLQRRLTLKRLYEGPQEDPDRVALSQQLDQASCSKQPQEADVDKIFLQNSYNRGCRM